MILYVVEFKSDCVISKKYHPLQTFSNRKAAKYHLKLLKNNCVVPQWHYRLASYNRIRTIQK